MGNLVVRRVETAMDVYDILIEFNDIFDPPLHLKIMDLKLYAIKLISKGYVYTASAEKKVLGFIAFYSNDEVENIGYLSQIAIKPNCMIKGIGYELIKQFEKECYKDGMKILKLEVNNDNNHAISFYKRNGYFHSEQASDNTSYMMKVIKS